MEALIFQLGSEGKISETILRKEWLCNRGRVGGNYGEAEGRLWEASGGRLREKVRGRTRGGAWGPGFIT